MPKDKFGNKLTWKEFGEKWKQGIEKITPLQQTKTQLRFTFIVLVGIISGIVFSIMSVKTLWWLMIILIGALGNTAVAYLGLWQKKRLLIRMEESIKLVSQEVYQGIPEELNLEEKQNE